MQIHFYPTVFLSTLLTSALVYAAPPCCEEQNFLGVGKSPEGVKIQLVEVARTSPEDIRVTWTLKNTTATPQVLTNGTGGSWGDRYKLAWNANLLDAAGRKKFNVAKDTDGKLVSATHQPDHRAGGIVLGAGKSITTWAKFIAPPTTTKVSVDLPGATMPWENVAVMDGNR